MLSLILTTKRGCIEMMWRPVIAKALKQAETARWCGLGDVGLLWCGMFTGLITDIGEVREIDRSTDARFIIATSFDMAKVDIGASIACSGACLTMVEKGSDSFAVDVSAETLACTTLGQWREGRRINLEQSLRLGAELGGHLVQGHVDGAAAVTARRPDGDSLRFWFEAPEELAYLIARKGSVAIDGISLTVNEVEGRTFGVNIIPHTAENTTLGMTEPGAQVNLEVDLLARYVARLQEGRTPA